MGGFERIWSRIESLEGQEFRQIRGKPFRYAVHGSAVRPDTTNQQIPRSHFEQAASLLPLSNTVPIQHLRGPSYIYAILMDPRVRQD